jgi:hypothetical protein
MFRREVESFEDSSRLLSVSASGVGGIGPAMTLGTHQPAG